MKKVVSLVLVSIMFFAFAGCKDKAEKASAPENQSTAATKNINDERIIGGWNSVYSAMSNGFSIDFYDGGIGMENIKSSGEYTYIPIEWYSVGDRIMVNVGEKFEMYTYGKNEDGEISLFLEGDNDELYKSISN